MLLIALFLHREKELAKVTIKKEDVELIVSIVRINVHAKLLNDQDLLPLLKPDTVFDAQMAEMEIPRGMAERSLREHMGNVVEALIALTN